MNLQLQVLSWTALISMLAGPLSGQSTPETVSRQIEGERINELALWDLGSDGIFEVFTTAVSGKAACYRADNLEPLWNASFAPEALTAPVIGDFLGTGSPVMAFASVAGKIFFVWPGSGETIASHSITTSFSLAPSVARLDTENLDLLVLPDDKGQVFVLGLSSDATIKERWVIPNTISGSGVFSVVGRTIQPASCSDLDRDGIPEIVVSSNEGVLQAVSLTTPPSRHFVRLAQRSEATTIAGAGPFVQRDKETILVGVDATLYAFEFLPSPNAPLKQLFQTPAYGKTQGHLVFAPFNGDDQIDVLTSADNVISARYAGKGFDGNQTLIDISAQQLTTINAPFSAAVPIIRADGVAAAIAIDGKGSILEWQPTAAANSAVELYKITPPTGYTPAGNLTGSDNLSMVTWTEADSSLSVLHLALALSKNSPPVLTLGGNYSRNGQYGPLWMEKWQTKQASATAALKSAQAALSSAPDDTPSTMDAASIVMGSAPLDPAASALLQKRNGSSPVKLIVSVVAGIALLGGLLLVLKLRKR